MFTKNLLSRWAAPLVAAADEQNVVPFVRRPWHHFLSDTVDRVLQNSALALLTKFMHECDLLLRLRPKAPRMRTRRRGRGDLAARVSLKDFR